MECDERIEISTAEKVLFSEAVGWICYWATMLLLAIAAAYLIRWQLAHPTRQMKDPWPLDIPPAWLTDWISPVSLTWSLASAAWCALLKKRSWKLLATSCGLAAVMVCTRLAEV